MQLKVVWSRQPRTLRQRLLGARHCCVLPIDSGTFAGSPAITEELVRAMAEQIRQGVEPYAKVDVQRWSDVILLNVRIPAGLEPKRLEEVVINVIGGLLPRLSGVTQPSATSWV